MKNIVIVGGGTSGWMTAAMLSKVLGTQINITLIQSKEIATIGVGEASIPPLVSFNQSLGIDDKTFIKATQGSFKLAICFDGWKQPQHRYYHAFGEIGHQVGLSPFHHIASANARSIWDFSVTSKMCDTNKMAISANLAGTPIKGPSHAYHFDAGLYAQLLQQQCQNDIQLIEATISEVKLSDDGAITSVITEQGQISGDLFIDCSGFKGLLIKQALKQGFESYANWLPTDRAIALPSKALAPLPNYTESTVHQAGWMWQIPLQHRTGNGIIYSSKHMDDEQALQTLLNKVGEQNVIGKPNFIKFTPGRTAKQWHKNCIAIGLSSGFLEPLESTSIHLVQSAILRLLKLFPRDNNYQLLQEEYNQQSQIEFEHIRDFIILHYHLNQRTEPMWQACQNMAIPTALAHKIALYQASGEIHGSSEDLFSLPAWLQVIAGQSQQSTRYNPSVDMMSKEQQRQLLTDINNIQAKACQSMPNHLDFLNKIMN
ncbi:tryptophan halogenase family protein [Paraferrimonas sp. SM1919]|uniref:tryptophan halogenase family protein n=1 Tax=Paraferrimonas sp. SM1919 TaxID=2662263 RepID=UPI0013D65EEE|nr:tryptophan halogenase family protein [Paraferrimonas sp. SM1919]